VVSSGATRRRRPGVPRGRGVVGCDAQASSGGAVTAMIIAVPIVWMHSFALLLAPVAVMRPRLSAVWLVPILLTIGPDTGNGEPWQTVGVLGVMVITLCLALFPRRDSSTNSGLRLQPGLRASP